MHESLPNQRLHRRGAAFVPRSSASWISAEIAAAVDRAGEAPDVLPPGGLATLRARRRDFRGVIQMTSSAHDASPSMIGRRFGNFVVRESIGRGSSGGVWKCEHQTTSAIGALKVLHSHRVDEVSRVRFQREARHLHAIAHPAIVGFLDFGEDPATGDLYLIMEFCEGKSLYTALQARTRFDEHTAARIGASIADALAALHSKGIWHRDLKPANVILRDGSIKVVDFGLARSEDDLQLTESGKVAGTPLYMAPEQFRGLKVANAASDVYSFGAMLYEFVTGSPPYPGHTVEEVFAAQTKGALVPPATRETTVSAAMNDLILECLRGDAATRPSMEQLFPRLLKIAWPGRIAATLVSEPARSTTDESARATGNLTLKRAIFILAPALALVLGAAGGFLLRRSSRLESFRNFFEANARQGHRFGDTRAPTELAKKSKGDCNSRFGGMWRLVTYSKWNGYGYALSTAGNPLYAAKDAMMYAWCELDEYGTPEDQTLTLYGVEYLLNDVVDRAKSNPSLPEPGRVLARIESIYLDEFPVFLDPSGVVRKPTRRVGRRFVRYEEELFNDARRQDVGATLRDVEALSRRECSLSREDGCNADDIVCLRCGEGTQLDYRKDMIRLCSWEQIRMQACTVMELSPRARRAEARGGDAGEGAAGDASASE